MEELYDDRYFMKIALKEAEIAASEDEVPIGAVVVCKNRIIAKTHNTTECLKDVTCHAEMLAITSAATALGGKYLNDCTLYVTIEPCTMCAGAIGWSQLGRLVYGADDPKKGFSIIAPSALHPKTSVTKGVEAEACSALIRNYFKNKR